MSQGKKRHVYQRLFCIPATPLAPEGGGWRFADGVLTVDLSETRGLSEPDSALRFESGGLPDRVLLVHGTDGTYYAYSNHCACGGFRIDPVPTEQKIRCCTLMQSTYDYNGKFLKGTANKDLTVYEVSVEGEALQVMLGPMAGSPKE